MLRFSKKGFMGDVKAKYIYRDKNAGCMQWS